MNQFRKLREENEEKKRKLQDLHLQKSIKEDSTDLVKGFKRTVTEYLAMNGGNKENPPTKAVKPISNLVKSKIPTKNVLKPQNRVAPSAPRNSTTATHM